MKYMILLGETAVPYSECKPFWSYEARAVEAVWCNSYFLDTPLLWMTEETLLANALVFRPLGSTIGSRCLLIRHSTFDSDSYHLGDDVVMSIPANQCHTFEGRVLKYGPVYVGDRVTMVHNSQMLGSKVGSDTMLYPNSMVMKHEELMPGEKYAGIPVQPLSDMDVALRRREFPAAPEPRLRQCVPGCQGLNARYKRGCLAF